uniref:ADP-ribosyl cyclase/cyclic ADP-ribose hydrolase n=1 Tax=Electrophorus electricus TaxID=8005 RepID=A0A4W4FPM7_ELEEL
CVVAFLLLFCRYSDCETIWQVFEQAYVGRDPCDVPPEAYYPLINLVKNQLACNTMLFWSKTKTLVHEFTENRECLVTLEDTLLGFTFNELTWCSKNQSKETFTTDCPLWSYCVNNPVRSFWIKASANVSIKPDLKYWMQQIECGQCPARADCISLGATQLYRPRFHELRVAFSSSSLSKAGNARC